MANFLYCPPTENQAPAGTWSASPGLASGFQASWIADERPERPSRLSVANGYWEVDFGSATRVDLVAILGHTVAAGATIQIQGGATSPPTTLSTAVVVPAARPDGLMKPLWVRLTDKAGYTATGYRYWRLSISGNTGIAQIGEAWFASQVRALPLGIRDGSERGERRLLVQHETECGVRLGYDRGVTLRDLRASVLVKTESDLQTTMDWVRAAKGSLRPSLVVPDDTDATECSAMVFDEARQSWTRRISGVREFSLALREVATGAV